MTHSTQLLPEFDEEMAKTRLVIERLPEDNYTWQVHQKSHTIGWNANHLAEIPGWVLPTIEQTEWDISPVGGPAYKTPTHMKRDEVLALFDANVATARRALESAADSTMAEPWSLKYQGETVFTMPRSQVIRSFVLNHMIHHRAMCCVYLRLNNVPVPGMYGPSGDE